MSDQLIPSKVFDELKEKIEEETEVRQNLGKLADEVEKQNAYALGLLSRIHSLPRAQWRPVLDSVDEVIYKQIKAIDELKELANKHPYYKYNQKWTHKIQDAIYVAMLNIWLGGLPGIKGGKVGDFFTLDDVETLYTVPVNVKDRDCFHVTIEEYLLAATQLTDELSRLATNSVTLGDYELAVKISKFIKDLHAGFQLLNLKNDILRKRVDAVKST